MACGPIFYYLILLTSTTQHLPLFIGLVALETAPGLPTVVPAGRLLVGLAATLERSTGLALGTIDFIFIMSLSIDLIVRTIEKG